MKRNVFDILNYDGLRRVSYGAQACVLALVRLFNEWATKTNAHKARDARRVVCAVEGLSLSENGVQWQIGFGLAIGTAQIIAQMRGEKTNEYAERVFRRAKYIEELEAANILQVVRRRGPQGNVYFLACGEVLDVSLIGAKIAPIAKKSNRGENSPYCEDLIGAKITPIKPDDSFSNIEENVCEECACASTHATHTHEKLIFSDFVKWYGKNIKNGPQYINTPQLEDVSETLAYIMDAYNYDEKAAAEKMQELLYVANERMKNNNKVPLLQVVRRYAKYDRDKPNNKAVR